RRRHKRGPHGAGCYPVLEALGIADRVSPATRSEIALHVVQAASYLGDAEAVWALLIGYLRLLGAAYADVVECIADGAEWIWKRVERLSSLAEIPAAKLVEVLDFYHASQYLYETIATDRRMSKAQRQTLYQRLRHALRHQADG